MTTHGYALNVDLDPAPFTQWITACGLEDAAFTTVARELGRPVTVDETRGPALEALAEVFELELEELPAETVTASGPSRCTPSSPCAADFVFLKHKGVLAPGERLRSEGRGGLCF